MKLFENSPTTLALSSALLVTEHQATEHQATEHQATKDLTMGIFQFTATEVIKMLFLTFTFGFIVGAIALAAFLFRDKLKSLLTLLPVLFLVPFLLTFAACSEKQSFDTTELQRQIANDNSSFNAQVWRANSMTPDYAIITRGDSTQTADCPQGDGWASIDLMSPDRKQVIGLKCSTYSKGIGCVTSSDFKVRAHLTNQENRCNADVPFPLPKIAK